MQVRSRERVSAAEVDLQPGRFVRGLADQREASSLMVPSIALEAGYFAICELAVARTGFSGGTLAARPGSAAQTVRTRIGGGKGMGPFRGRWWKTL
ncbi:MAG: hypothetical protein U1G05_00765 [Kiritimatiellia bacterium]